MIAQVFVVLFAIAFGWLLGELRLERHRRLASREGSDALCNQTGGGMKMQVAVFQPKASVEIAHDFFINTETPQPNWWWRFWQWVLLGWKWKSLLEKPNE